MARKRRKERPGQFAADMVAAVLVLLGLWLSTRQPTSSATMLPGIVASLVSAFVIRALLLRILNRPAKSVQPWSPSAHTASPSPDKNIKHVWSNEPSLTPANDLYEVWKGAQSSAPEKVALDTSRWSLELLRALEWHRFEQVCAAYFRAIGLRAELSNFGADGGIDIRLYAPGTDNAGTLVQCKAWNTYRVGVEDIRHLMGSMLKHSTPEGCFITTSTFTPQAHAEAQGMPLRLIDGETFLGLIEGLSEEARAALLQMATQGDYRTPTCPSCGIKMTLRTPKKGGEPFWGCVNFSRRPPCRTMLPYMIDRNSEIRK